MNGVLVGESAFRATERHIEYREHEPVQANADAEAQLERALAFYRSVGAEHYLCEADSLRAALEA